MSATNTWRARLVTFCAAAAALIVTAAGAAVNTGVGAKSASSSPAPVVKIETGPVRGSPGGWWLRLPRVAVRRRPHRAAEMAAPAAPPPTGTVSATRPSSHRAARSRWSATAFFPPGPIAEGLYLNALHAVSAQPPRRWSPGARVDPRAVSRKMPPATTTAPSSRRRALSSSRSTTGWAPQLPCAPGALAAGRLNRQLRLDGPAGGAAVDPAQHRKVRRRPGQRDDRGPVGRRPVGARPPGLARLARALPAGDRAERRLRADAAFSRRRRGFRQDVRRKRERPRRDRGVSAWRAGRQTHRQVPARSDSERRRWRRAHRIDRVGVRRRAVHPRADPERHQPRRGVPVRRRPWPGRSNGMFVGGASDSPASYQSAIAAVLGCGREGRRCRAEYPVAAYPLPAWPSPRSSRMRTSRVPALQIDLGVPACRPSRTSSTTTPHRIPWHLPARCPSHPFLGAFVPVRPAERAVPSGAERRPGGPCRQHAHGLGEACGERRPIVGRTAVAVVRQRRTGAVAPAASATGRRRERGDAPLRVLVRRLATASSEGDAMSTC